MVSLRSPGGSARAPIPASTIAVVSRRTSDEGAPSASNTAGENVQWSRRQSGAYLAVFSALILSMAASPLPLPLPLPPPDAEPAAATTKSQWYVGSNPHTTDTSTRRSRSGPTMWLSGRRSGCDANIGSWVALNDNVVANAVNVRLMPWWRSVLPLCRAAQLNAWNGAVVASTYVLHAGHNRGMLGNGESPRRSRDMLLNASSTTNSECWVGDVVNGIPASRNDTTLRRAWLVMVVR